MTSSHDNDGVDLLCQFFLSTQKIEKEQADKAKLIWQDYTDRLKQTLVGA